MRGGGGESGRGAAAAAAVMVVMLPLRSSVMMTERMDVTASALGSTSTGSRDDGMGFSLVRTLVLLLFMNAPGAELRPRFWSLGTITLLLTVLLSSA